MGIKIKRKKLFEADAPVQQPVNGQQPTAQAANNTQQQQAQQAPTFNGQEIINKISGLQVAAVSALQETYKKVTTDIPELSASANDANSPIAKEAKEFLAAIDGFTNGKADQTKPETITAAMASYGNIAEKLKVLIDKISETIKVQQPATTQQQPAQPAQTQQPVQQATVNGQPAQPAQPAQQTTESVKSSFGSMLNEKIQAANEAARPNTFGFTLNEKIRTANFKRMFDNMDVN